MDKIEFYAACAEIMSTTHDTIVRPAGYRRNRWTNRNLGNGRFPGFGVIRFFGGPVHIALNHPIRLTKAFETPEDALDCLRAIFKEGKDE